MSKTPILRRNLLMLCLPVALLVHGGSVTTHSAPPAAERPAAGPAAAAPVDVNTADETDLTAVPGIGKSLARRIIEFREKNGPFTRVDDLLKVRGIGEKSIEKLRPYVTVAKAK